DEPVRRQLMAAELNHALGATALAELAAAYPDEIERTKEGWLEDSYFVSLDAGNMAWAMLALVSYHERVSSGDSKYLDTAIALGEWVARNCNYGDGVGYTGG